jgi:hypothetical protein
MELASRIDRTSRIGREGSSGLHLLYVNGQVCMTHTSRIAS